MFGGQTSDFPPPRSTAFNPNLVDHMWPGRDNTAAEERRRKQEQYAEELRQQIKDRELMKKRLKEEDNFQVVPYSKPAPQNQTYNRPPPSYTNTTSSYQPPAQQNYTSRTSNSLSSTYSSKATSNQFAETLKQQIDERRKGSYSSMTQPIQTVALSQPQPTFAAGSTFDSTQFDLSGTLPSLRSRAGQDHQRVRSVSMIGTASIRSTIETTQIQPPIILSESPLDHCKVATPAAGFSVRRNRGRNSNINVPVTSNSYSQASTYGPGQRRRRGAELSGETQMIYPDGHYSPV